jgi:hypothetical protein
VAPEGMLEEDKEDPAGSGRRKHWMTSPRANIKIARTLAALATLTALAAGSAAVSGCGASATFDPVARAAEVSSQQQGARITLTTQLSSPMLPGGSVSITAHGYLDERNHSGEMTLDLSNLPGAAALSGGEAGTIQVLFQYPVLYLHLPFLAGKLPEGKTWLKLDLTKAAQAAGVNLAQLSSLDQADPAQLLEYLRASSGGVTTVGHESIEGASTIHYRATLQLSSVLARLPAGDQAAARAALEKLGHGAESGIPVDVWVDTQGRVRRVQVSFGGGSAASMSGMVTIDYTSYGPVPPVVPPAAGEVLDESSLAAAGLAAASRG